MLYFGPFMYKYPVRLDVETLKSNDSLARKYQYKLVAPECEVSFSQTPPGSLIDSGS